MDESTKGLPAGRQDKPENKDTDCDKEQEKKEVKQPLFSDEVFKDDLDLIERGKDDLDKLPI
jgi:hypothetical protein